MFTQEKRSSENVKPTNLERWHHASHRSTIRTGARNSLPRILQIFFHPTHVVLSPAREQKEDNLTEARDGSQKQQRPGLREDTTRLWSSRSHRKQRYTKISPLKRTNRRAGNVLRGIWNLTHLEYWNISWWLAVGFTLGSIVWVINGFATFLPFGDPKHFETADNSRGWTAFLGATIFEFSSVFGMWEAWNRGHVVKFGSAVGSVFGKGTSKLPYRDGYQTDDEELALERDSSGSEDTQPWKWFSLDPRYFRELGFLGAFFQFLGASIFWISGFTAIPAIQSAIKENTALIDGVYWLPQVVGGSGFIISSTFLMLEAQHKWWKPEILSLGWHVGFWNFVGGVGFTLSGALGFSSSSGAEYQSALSTFWGGWGFLIGSVIQWYESVNGI